MTDTNLCPICGSPYSLDKQGNLYCRFCGHIKPKASSDKEEVQLIAAEQALRRAAFDEAQETYENIVEEFPESAEANWGVTLSQYGIKFEIDADRTRIPTCYATQYESIFDNDHYKKALSYASEEQKAFYEKMAARIEKTRKEWVEKAEKEPPYDIFLSYKDTEGGERTEDSLVAHDLYNILTGLGYRVFFSRVTLAGKTGENYEPYIFSALNSAPVMLVFASKPEYVTSTWVKNEWNRFLTRIKNGQKQEGSLAVVFRNFSPSALPRALSGLQNLKYGEITFLSNLKSYVNKYIEGARAASFQIKRKEVAIAKKQGKKSLEAVKAESITSISKKKRSSAGGGTLSVERRQIGSNVGRLSANEESKLVQAEIYLSKNEFMHAVSLYEEVLEKSPKNAEALLGKVLCDSSAPDLVTWIKNNWEKEETIKMILEAATHASEETANKILQGFADGCLRLAWGAHYQEALSVFSKIADYDSKATNELPDKLLKECLGGYAKTEGTQANRCIALAYDCLKYASKERQPACKRLIDLSLSKNDFDGADKLFYFYESEFDLSADDYLSLLQTKGHFTSRDDLLNHVGESGNFSCFTNDLPLHSEEINDLFDVLSDWALKYIKLHPSSAPKYIPFLAAYRFPEHDEMIQRAIDYCCEDPNDETATLLDGVLNSFGDDSFEQFSSTILRFSEAAVEKAKAPLAERYLSKLIEYDPDNASLYEKRILAHLVYHPFSDPSALCDVIGRLDDFKDIESLIALRGKKKVGEVIAPYLDACLISQEDFENAVKVFDALCAYLPEEESGTLRSYLEKMAPICQEKGLFEYAEKYYSTLIALDPMVHQYYWNLLQSKLHCKDDNGLIACDTPLGECIEFENAKLAASGDKEALAHHIDIEVKQSEALKVRQVKQLAKNKRKKARKKVAWISGIALAAAAALSVLTATVFVPAGTVSGAARNIRNGNYQEAIATLSKTSFGSSGDLLNMAYAGTYFSKNSYETGIDYVLKAGGETTVHYDAKGGFVSTTEETIRPKRRNINNSAYKLGYDSSWKQTKFEINIDGGYSASLWLEATYTIKRYSITYVLSGGKNSPSNPSYYTVNDSFSFIDPTREGYTFEGWTNKSGKRIESISRGTTGDMTLTATWNDGDQYLLTLDPDGGEVESSTVSVQYDKEYALPTPTKKGYEFLGWHLENSTDIFPAEGTWRWTEVSKLVASWSPCTYTITYEGITDIPSSWPTTYTIDDEVILPEATLQGHTFQGWTDEEGEEITSIPAGSVGDRVFTANWEKYALAVLLEADSIDKGTISIKINDTIEGERICDFATKIPWDSVITLTAEPADGYLFQGWYEKDTSTLVNKAPSYTFKMPSADYCLVARFWTQADKEEAWKSTHGSTPVFSSDGKKVTYGLYPQTRVKDSSLVAALQTLDESFVGANGWYLYEDEYYAKLSAEPYELNYKFNDGTVIAKGKTYWFKCEPITWDVLTNANGESKVISNVLLDASCYRRTRETTIIDDNVKLFANNYEHSDIRAWLNGDFYDTAFAFGASHVLTTVVDNSAATTDSTVNLGACANTNDKIFLPSYKDYLNYNWALKNCKTTDWARARGASYDSGSSYLYNGTYWTRSPYSGGSDRAWVLSSQRDLTYAYVDSANNGVRPAFRLSGVAKTLSVKSVDETKGTVSIVSGSGYAGETIKILAQPKSGYLFQGWYEEKTSTLVTKYPSYTFVMPSSDYGLVARFWSQAEKDAVWNPAHGVTPTLSEDGETITYGLYPQAEVSDSALRSSLNALGDSAKGANGWYLYDDEYYAKLIVKKSSYSTETYWFKCEPIKWNVISEANGEYYVLSDLLLDAHYYYNSSKNRTIGTKTVYPNNYEHSDIRTWLNSDFYNSAFALGDSAIEVTTVDNSAATTDSSSNYYACANTNDKVFLPSYKEIMVSRYDSSSSSSSLIGSCKTTDWARRRGASCDSDFNGIYWTRSPYSSSSTYAWCIDTNGSFRNDDYNGGYITNANWSVRPGLSIRIE